MVYTYLVFTNDMQKVFYGNNVSTMIVAAD